ncbi:MAG: NAAT family transporter [Chitinophagaceae bacterium]|jgi:multiple antibiotic resistance protein|nr:NAAT family transporter [Chitinophagaceae bacterium]
MIKNLPTVLQHLLFIVPVTYMALFHVVNPIGSGVLFLNFTPNAGNALRKKIARKVSAHSFIILVVTLLLGIYILKLFGITIPIVQICGGMLIVSMGWKSLSQDDSINASDSKKMVTFNEREETYMSQTFYPYTFPFTVGPGSIAVTLTISAESFTGSTSNDMLQLTGAIVALILMSITIYVCYSYTDYLMRRIPEQVRRVIMKILSFILLCIGGQIVMNGITGFLEYIHKSGVL